MHVDECFWLDAIVEKLAVKHRLSQNEVEEVFANEEQPPFYRFSEPGISQPGEDVYSASGRTEAGRYLIVFFVNKPNYVALVVSARDMSLSERKLYDRR